MSRLSSWAFFCKWLASSSSIIFIHNLQSRPSMKHPGYVFLYVDPPCWISHMEEMGFEALDSENQLNHGGCFPGWTDSSHIFNKNRRLNGISNRKSLCPHCKCFDCGHSLWWGYLKNDMPFLCHFWSTFSHLEHLWKIDIAYWHFWHFYKEWIKVKLLKVSKKDVKRCQKLQSVRLLFKSI